jgi:hypothetical protein
MELTAPRQPRRVPALGHGVRRDRGNPPDHTEGWFGLPHTEEQLNDHLM